MHTDRIKIYAILAVLVLLSFGLSAQPFSLDETWSTGDYPGYTARPYGILLDKENDRILYWGMAQPVNPPPSIARYTLSTGELDLIFSSIDFPVGDIKRLPDNGYLRYGAGASMLKFNADGTINTTFTQNLHASATNFIHHGGGTNLHVYPDGRLLAGCGYPCLGLWHQPTEHQAPFRLLPDGKVDSTFNISSNGAVSGIRSFNDSLLIVYGMFMEYDDVPMFAVARIDTAGVLDTTFQSPFVFPTNPFVYLIDKDDKLLVAGSCYLPSNDTIYNLVRLHPDGSVDESFKKLPRFVDQYYTSIYDVQQTMDGGYLVVGMFNGIHGQPRGNIAKLHADGSLDEAYFTGQGLVYDTADLSQPHSSFARRIVYDEEADHYYIIGRAFSYFNGKRVPRVMRLRGLISGTRQPEKSRQTFSLFPNPASGTVSLQLPEEIPRPERIRVAVYNSIGQQVLAQAYPASGQLNIQQLPPGMYVVHLQHEELLFQPQKLVVW